MQHFERDGLLSLNVNIEKVNELKGVESEADESENNLLSVAPSAPSFIAEPGHVRRRASSISINSCFRPAETETKSNSSVQNGNT